MAARSWHAAHLRRGSFRGVPFSIERSDREAGRAVVSHEGPGWVAPYHEDLGRLARRFAVDAILVGDDVLAQEAALVAALETPGPGELIHPYYGRLWVTAVGPQQVRQDIREGRLACLRLQFEQADGSGVGQPRRTADTGAGVSGAAGVSVRALVADLAGALGLSGWPDWVRDTGLSQVSGALSAARGALALAGAVPGGLLGAALAPVSALIPAALTGGAVVGRGRIGALVAGLTAGTGLEALTAGRLLLPFALAGLTATGGRSLTGTAALAAAVPGAPAGLAALVRDLTGGASETLDAAPALEGFLTLAGDGTAERPGWSPDALPPAWSEAGQVARANREAMITAVRAGAAGAAAGAASAVAFDNRDQALVVRDRVADALDAAAERAADAGWTGSYRALVALSAASRADLTVAAQPLPVLGVFTPAGVVPALVVAQQLWGDDPALVLERAAELVTRNAIPHPAFTGPGALEVRSWA